MKVFLAGTAKLKNHQAELAKCKYFLESFLTIQEWQIPYAIAAEMFLLDSGAFTFMKGKRAVNWEEYIEQYAEFINQHDIKHFFELDIDSVVGYEKVKQYRNTLESITNKQSIPVWHINRGLKEWKSLCDAYSYVAIGGIAIKRFKPSNYKYLPGLINEAHKRGAIIHGLGFTNTTKYKTIIFDTVDSTTWIVGGKYGNVCRFQNGIMRQIYTPGMRCVKQDELMLHNYAEWLKFQQYAEVHL